MIETCDWTDCHEPATHTVTSTLPGWAPETMLLCRTHESERKTQVVRSRPKPPADPEVAAVPNVVRCGGCGVVLDEPSSTPGDRRTPCASCGSTVRNIAVHLTETLSFRESLQAVQERPGQGVILDTLGGDSYTFDLEAWGKLGRTYDKRQEPHRYGETIELWDCTRIESTALLRDHTARRPKAP